MSQARSRAEAREAAAQERETKLREEIGEAREQRAKVSAELAVVQTELAVAKARGEDLSAAAPRLQEDLASAHAELAKALEREQQALARVAAIERDAEVSREALEERMGVEVATLREAVREAAAVGPRSPGGTSLLDRFREQVGFLKDALEVAISERDSLDADLATARSALEVARADEAEALRLAGDRGEALEVAVRDRNATAASLAAAEVSLAAAREEVARATARAAAAEAALAEAKAEIASLEARLRDAAAREAELTRSSLMKLDFLSASSRAAAKDNEGQAQALVGLHEALTHLAEELATIRAGHEAEAAECVDQVRQLGSTLASEWDENIRLALHVKDEIAARETLARELSQATEELERAHRQIEHETNRAEELAAQVHTLNILTFIGKFFFFLSSLIDNIKICAAFARRRDARGFPGQAGAKSCCGEGPARRGGGRAPRRRGG